MSLVGLLTATEKQVHLGRLHMRPIHWHLKNQEKKDNVIHSQPLHPPKYALQDFTDASKEGGRGHLGEHTARGNLIPSRKQIAHKLSGT